MSGATVEVSHACSTVCSLSLLASAAKTRTARTPSQSTTTYVLTFDVHVNQIN